MGGPEAVFENFCGACYLNKSNVKYIITVLPTHSPSPLWETTSQSLQDQPTYILQKLGTMPFVEVIPPIPLRKHDKKHRKLIAKKVLVFFSPAIWDLPLFLSLDLVHGNLVVNTAKQNGTEEITGQSLFRHRTSPTSQAIGVFSWGQSGTQLYCCLDVRGSPAGELLTDTLHDF